MKTLLLILILIILITPYCLNFNIKENYSSLSTIYPNIINRQIDLCPPTKTNVSPDVNTDVSSDDINANKFKCIDDKTMNSLISANYLYIYSYPFKKLLAFDAYDTQSFVYLDSKTPKINQCLNVQQYEEHCRNNIDTLPQKWRIDIKDYLNPTKCLVTISSYSCNGLKYYLGCDDKNLYVSLIGGSDNQVWEIIKREIDDNTTDENIYLIKSHKSCLYLGANNQGYVRSNSGMVYLTEIKTKYVGNEMLWNIMTCGKRSIPTLPQKETYKSFQSTYDYPSVSRNKIGVNDKDYGRNVWLKEFNNIWNGEYQYTIIVKNNKLEQIDNKNRYKIVEVSSPINLSVRINLNNNSKDVISNNGTVILQILGNPTITEHKIDGVLITKDGISNQKTYKTYSYQIESVDAMVETYGSDVLRGDGIFLRKVLGNDKVVEMTVMNKDGNVRLKEKIVKK